MGNLTSTRQNDILCESEKSVLQDRLLQLQLLTDIVAQFPSLDLGTDRFLDKFQSWITHAHELGKEKHLNEPQVEDVIEAILQYLNDQSSLESSTTFLTKLPEKDISQLRSRSNQLTNVLQWLRTNKLLTPSY